MKCADPTFLHSQLQAGLLIGETQFNEEVGEEPLEPLHMEHFHFPLILWLGGLVLSSISFIVEIITKCIKKKDT